MIKNLYVKNLSNKQPTKDITLDDIKNKIPLITSKRNRCKSVQRNSFF